MSFQSKVRDRDVFKDSYGRIFTVLGYIQPPDRILSILKYVPDPSGRWASGGISYQRVFWGGVDSVVKGAEELPPEYLITDSHFGTVLVEPPREAVSEYFKPEHRLKEILSEGPRDILEERVHHLTNSLHDNLGISIDRLGVAGSILWRGHNPDFSDINMNIYGLSSTKVLREHLAQLQEVDSRLKLRKISDWANAMSRVQTRIPLLSDRDLQMIFSRRNAVCVDGQCVGITPVLYPDEAPIKYSTERYITLDKRPVTILATITDSKYSLFHPSLYVIEPVMHDSCEGGMIDRLMVYDGAFGGLFHEGDEIEVSGTLQRVEHNGEVTGYQLMIGTKEGFGKEFIRPVNQFHRNYQ